MSSVSVFAGVHPVIWVVWFVGMGLSITFIIQARSMHRRNVQERIAKACRDTATAGRQPRDLSRSAVEPPTTHASLLQPS
jgi:hypothetical protein